LLTFFVGLIFSQIFGPFSLYLKEVYQLPENQIGQLLAVNTILIVLFEMLLMHWLRNLAPVQAVSLGVVFVGGGFALMPWGSGFFFAALTVAVWTIGEMLTLPMLITLVAGRADENSQGRYQGLFGLAFSFSIIAGPYLGTQIYSTLGASWLWLSCGMLGIMISLGFQVLAIRIRRLPA
jgi:predicted MFS family arabinose efflux permease